MYVVKTLKHFFSQIMVVKIIFWAILIVIGWALLVSVISFFTYFRPPKIPITRTPDEFGLSYEKIEFKATDGQKLSGWFIPTQIASKKTIILLHGFISNKEDLISLSSFLHPEYNLFLFDFRAHGESSGRWTSIGLYETRDCLGAINYLKKEKPEASENLGAFGFSLGAAVAIMAIGQTEKIEAVVADSSYASFDRMVLAVYRQFAFMKKPLTFLARGIGKLFFRVDIAQIAPKEVVKNIKTPILLIHGANDSLIKPEDSEIIYENCLTCELWLVRGAAHGQAWFIEPDQYQKRVLDFFEKHLTPSSTTLKISESEG